MQALGSSIVDLLLGEYIEGVDQRQLELDVLNGHLLLQNLAVKDVALQRLQLPVLVKAGIIGKVELDIDAIRARPHLFSGKKVCAQLPAPE